jgi:hypothetical protein
MGCSDPARHSTANARQATTAPACYLLLHKHVDGSRLYRNYQGFQTGNSCQQRLVKQLAKKHASLTQPQGTSSSVAENNLLRKQTAHQRAHKLQFTNRELSAIKPSCAEQQPPKPGQAQGVQCNQPRAATVLLHDSVSSKQCHCVCIRQVTHSDSKEYASSCTNVQRVRTKEAREPQQAHATCLHKAGYSRNMAATIILKPCNNALDHHTSHAHKPPIEPLSKPCPGHGVLSTSQCRVQHSTAQHSTAQHGTAQHSTALTPAPCCSNASQA